MRGRMGSSSPHEALMSQPPALSVAPGSARQIQIGCHTTKYQAPVMDYVAAPSYRLN